MALIGLAGLISAQAIIRKGKNAPKKRKMFTWIAIAVLIVGALPALGITNYGVSALGNQVSFGGSTLAIGGGENTNQNTGGGSSNGGITTYAPTATYATTDKYAQTTAITGTAYYSLDGSRFGTSSYTNPGKQSSVSYWIDNSSAQAGQYWVAPLTQTVVNSNPNFQNLGYKNGTGSVSLYDITANTPVAVASHNVTLAANGQANIRLTYTPTNKQSAIPFGGDFVVEYNSSISSVSCNGEGIEAQSPFHTTYTVTNTNDKFTIFHVLGVQDGTGFDDATGKIRTIDCQFLNGGSVPGTGNAYYFKFIPANYYLGQDGLIRLDTEKYADGLTTRVGSQTNFISSTNYWA